ncbi:MAG: hypothetical protein GY761_03970 [Hyphomicrobiales bacterium]|nr:hypothetical protein [Hyphomicrobiales bacterium]
MYTSAHNQSNPAISHLPKAFELALRRVNHSDGFNEAISYAAKLADCEYLFEIPGALFGDEDGRAAVMRSLIMSEVTDCAKLDDEHIFYIIFNASKGVIRIIEEFEVPLSIHAMTHSYSRVLEYLANDFDNATISSLRELN